jgi:cytochrome c biogenesis protein CcdA
MTLLAIIAGAFAMGVATAISPCPLTTNIAAISFLSRNVGDSRRVLLSAGLYTLGRTIVYVALGVALIWAYQAATGETGDLKEFASPASRHAQRYGEIILGPVLLLIGIVLLGLVELNFSVSVGGVRLQERLARAGAFWSLPVGMLFALVFCPPSASWFIAAVGISMESDSLLPGPVAYGIGTAVPVIAFALVIAFAGQHVGKAFNAMTTIERWFRLVAGVIFVAAGLYYTLTNIYGVPTLFELLGF